MSVNDLEERDGTAGGRGTEDSRVGVGPLIKRLVGPWWVQYYHESGKAKETDVRENNSRCDPGRHLTN